MIAFFICYGLQSIWCENTHFMNLNNLIPKASFSVSRFTFGHFERSDGIFHQNLCILKLNWMKNSHFGTLFRLRNGFGNCNVFWSWSSLQSPDRFLPYLQNGQQTTLPLCCTFICYKTINFAFRCALVWKLFWPHRKLLSHSSAIVMHWHKNWLHFKTNDDGTKESWTHVEAGLIKFLETMWLKSLTLL